MAAKNRTEELCEILLEQLNEFRKHEEFIDITLICNDISIVAHKNILAAASPYFKAMFSGGNYVESAQKEVHMQEMDAECLQMTIDFIYTGSLYINVECAEDLFMTAQFLHLDLMMDLCIKYMIDSMDANNCLSIRRFAEKQRNFSLLEIVNNFILLHFKDVIQSEEFIEMRYEEIDAVLKKDYSNVLSDDVVLAGFARWAKHSPDKRLPRLSFLLRYIHPVFVSVEMARSLPIQQDFESVRWLRDVVKTKGELEWGIFVLDKMQQEGELKCFDINFDKSTTLEPLPRPSFGLSMSAYKNFLYVQGGSVLRSTRQSYCYNICSNEWRNSNRLLVERSHHRSVVLHDNLYALGGNTLEGATSSIECLNLMTNKPLLEENMWEERTSMGAVVCDNCIYVMGGETENRSIYSAERYDPRIGLWHKLPAMRHVNSYCTSAAIDQTIYCSEGLGSCMERFDIRANEWTVIDFWEQREFYEIFTVDNNLFSISGDTISRYDIRKSEWITKYKFPETRSWDTVSVVYMLKNDLNLSIYDK